MQFENQNHVAVEDYMQMIKLKTAVLLAACLKVGAIIGGASEEQASLLYDFGINIGLGFQLQDDYLDSFGDEKSFGKAIGGDILVITSYSIHYTKLYDWLESQSFELVDLRMMHFLG